MNVGIIRLGEADQRDFASMPAAMQAKRYEIIVDEDAADRAAELLRVPA